MRTSPFNKRKNKNTENKNIENKNTNKTARLLSAPANEDVPQNASATVRRLFKYLEGQKGRLCLIIFSAFLSSLLFAIMPLIVGMGIDGLVAVYKSQSGDKLAMTGEVLFLPVVLLVIFSLVMSLLAYIQQYVVASVGERLTLALRQDISGKINRLPLGYFDRHKTGDIMSRTTNDIEKVSEVMQSGLMQFISSVFTVILTFVAMACLSPILFFVVLVSAGASLLATRYVSGLTQKAFSANLAAVGDLNEKLEELYSGNRILKVFNQSERAIEEVCALNEKQYRAGRKAQFVLYAIYPAIRLINELGFIGTAITGGVMAFHGMVTLGTVQAFLQYVNQVSEPLTQTAYVVTSLQGAIAGAERVFLLLDQEEEPADRVTAVEKTGAGSVEFRHVRFGYSSDKLLMKDLNLEVRPNEMVAIVGPTGGGKTTLVNLLMRFYELSGGTISIDGTDITAMSRGELRKRIGMVLQDTWLFEGTVAENLAYGNKNATREEIVAAAKAARCDHFIRTLPQGYDTIISGDTAQISQGQLQLLTIARAMLNNPSIMILDEATSSVDTRTEVEIQKAMARLMKDKTSFVIAHRLSTIKNADMILVVKDGDIIEKGTHASLLAQKGFYASLYFSQFQGEAAS